MRVSAVQVWLGFLLVLALAGPAGAASSTAGSSTNAWMGAALLHVEFTPTPKTGGLSSGLRIEGVWGEPAISAGLRDDDIILDVDGKPTPDLDSYMQVARGIVAGTTVPVVILRGQERLTIRVRYISPPPDVDTLRSQYYAGCINRGQRSVASALERRDYQTAFKEDIRTARCADRASNAQAYTAAVVAFAKIVPKLRPSPAIPSEAERHNERAVSILKDAKDDDDIDKASREFGEAVVEAPWVPDLYLNLALSYDKAGYPEWATQYLRSYLLLNPTARDADQIREKIAELEVLAEERKPWLRFATSFTLADGSSGSLSLRGRKLVIRVVNHADQGQSAEAGDGVFLSATIHGNRLEGKAFVHPHVPLAEPFSRKDPEGWVRCFGPSAMALDAEGEIQPGGSQFRVRVKEPSYNTQSCVVVDHSWQQEVTWNVRAGQ